MKKLIERGAAASLVAVLFVTLAFAAATKFTNVLITGTLGVTGVSSLGAVTATTVDASSSTFAGGLQVFSFGAAASSTTFAPGVVGRIYRDSSNTLYIATATTAGGLTKVGAQ